MREDPKQETQPVEEEMGRSKAASAHKQIESKAGGDNARRRQETDGGNSCRQRLLLTFPPLLLLFPRDYQINSHTQRERERGSEGREVEK